jgi:predicted Zn-dependent protease
MMVPRDSPAASTAMESYFDELARDLDGLREAGETHTAHLAGETSDFVRFNRGRIRQPGTVTQAYLHVDLIRGSTHAAQTIALAGDLATDRAAIAGAIADLRRLLPDLTPDPHLDIATEPVSSRHVVGAPLPAAESIVDTVIAEARDLDFVGLYAGGPVYRGFANSYGQRNWHVASCFNLQWSLYYRADKAVKCAYSGLAWDAEAFAATMAEARDELARIAQPAKALGPGRCRAYLAPAAMEEIAGMLAWDGFSARALATRQSPLTRMHGPEGTALDPAVTMREAITEGIAPAFQSEGYPRPAEVPLIENGRLVGALVSPRTAREFAAAFGSSNGANAHEMPEALAMAGGTLPIADALAALDTGLWIGNLHYLNFSDRNACRLTGMTRFATFWVERGRIVAPVDVLRFDDTLDRMLGTNLEALTTETEFLLASETYRQRSLSSVRLPGALLAEMAFTL